MAFRHANHAVKPAPQRPLGARQDALAQEDTDPRTGIPPSIWLCTGSPHLLSYGDKVLDEVYYPPIVENRPRTATEGRHELAIQQKGTHDGMVMKELKARCVLHVTWGMPIGSYCEIGSWSVQPDSEHSCFEEVSR